MESRAPESRIPRMAGSRGSGTDAGSSASRGQVTSPRRIVEGIVREALTSAPGLKEMIQQAVKSHVDAELVGLRQELEHLRTDLTACRNDLEAQNLKSCEQDIGRLDEDVAALREYTQKTSDALWQQIAQMHEKTPNGGGPLLATKEEDPDRDDAHGDRRSSSRPERARSPSPSPERSRRRKARRGRKREESRRRGRKSVWRDDSASSDSSEDSDIGSESEAEGIHVVDRHCRKALSVEKYRLDDRSSERRRSNTSKLLKSVQHLFTGDRFDGSDPITVLHFLEELQSAFNDAQIAEGDAKHIVRYFLYGEAAKLFKGLSPRDRDTYPRIIRWLLRTYVRETMLQTARENFLTRSQRSNENELDYSKELRVLARRCGGVISDEEIIQRYVRGLQPAIRTQVQARISDDVTWATVVSIAVDHGNAHREATTLSRSRHESRFLDQPRRRSSETARALMADATPAPQAAYASEEELFLPESVAAPTDGEALAILPSGSRPPSRGPSWNSNASSSGSTSTWWTAPSPASVTFVPPAPARRVSFAPPMPARRVMLPPGVPFPARATSTAPKLACWGCGKESLPIGVYDYR